MPQMGGSIAKQRQTYIKSGMKHSGIKLGIKIYIGAKPGDLETLYKNQLK